MTNTFKIFKENEKLDEAFDILVEKVDAICKQYQLTYYELFGLLECLRNEISFKLDMEREDDN